jgi:hypothetical protein
MSERTDGARPGSSGSSKAKLSTVAFVVAALVAADTGVGRAARSDEVPSEPAQEAVEIVLVQSIDVTTVPCPPSFVADQWEPSIVVSFELVGGCTIRDHIVERDAASPVPTHFVREYSECSLSARGQAGTTGESSEVPRFKMNLDRLTELPIAFERDPEQASFERWFAKRNDAYAALGRRGDEARLLGQLPDWLDFAALAPQSGAQADEAWEVEPQLLMDALFAAGDLGLHDAGSDLDFVKSRHRAVTRESLVAEPLSGTVSARTVSRGDDKGGATTVVEFDVEGDWRLGEYFGSIARASDHESPIGENRNDWLRVIEAPTHVELEGTGRATWNQAGEIESLALTLKFEAQSDLVVSVDWFEDRDPLEFEFPLCFQGECNTSLEWKRTE